VNFRRTRAIARKELLHIVRDSRSLVAAVVLPLLMLLIFGYALSLDVDQIPTTVYDLSHTPESRDLIAAFRGSKYFDVVDEVQSYRPIERDMDRRRILVGVVIPADFSRKLAAGLEAPVQLLIDGSDSNTASIALGYAEGLVQSYAARKRDEALNARAGGTIPKPAVTPQVRVWYNTDLVSRDFIIPGLIAVIIMIIAALLTSLTISREWENGTMEQLLSTPVRPTELAMGKLAAYFLLGTIDLAICVFVGIVVFNVPFKGSPMLMMISSFVFLFGALGWGIFISASNRNQLAAYQLGTMTSFLPAFLLSGFIYSIDNMPRVVQAISLIVPARYFINIVKGVFVKGTGLRILWFDFLLLVIYGVVVFFLAARKLRQKVA
jgi:ABC-2 type transport system permease protein